MSFSTRVLLVLLATGCRAAPAMTNATDAGPIVGVSNPSPQTVAAACAVPLGDRLWVSSVPELRAVMLGRWFRCPAPPSPDGDGGTYTLYPFSGRASDPVEAGVELDDDGQFRIFDWGAGSSFVPRPGLFSGGTFSFMANGTDDFGRPNMLIDFEFDSGASGGGDPVLSNVPRIVLFGEQEQFIAETR